MRKLIGAAFGAAVLTLTPSVASAQATVAGFDSSAMASCDDCFSSPQNLGFTANFYGTSYSSTFVSNNGYVTFGSGQGSYSPEGLGAGYAGLPIIAAFFTDLDTRDGGGGDGGVVSYGAGTFAGRNAFGVNYDAVGRYPTNTTLLNTFQILLVDRGDVGVGDFDIYLNYDDIQFGSSASAGYNAGQPGNPAGTYFQLAGSLNGEAFANGQSNALVSNSNVGVAGRYLFQVRSGVAAPAVPEPATWAMMIAGFGLVGGSMRSSRTLRRTVAA